jgi:N-acetylmuramic acid 6-phosphate etherase
MAAFSTETYRRLPTEQPNPVSRDLDRLSVPALARLMNRQDAVAHAAVRRALPAVIKGVEIISKALGKGGRLFFMGAGTSGRLGVMEAAECPPTFNTPPGLVQAFMAGGPKAVFQSQEGAEDRGWEAERLVQRYATSRDVVVGIAASGVTPFVLMGLAAARTKKAKRILVTCHPGLAGRGLADVVIAAGTGPEILTGSTRLKAGTATKLILNMLTTLSMVRLGKVYKHWMVDLQPKSNKLRARAIRLIERLGGVSPTEAARLLKKSGGRAKVAILMAKGKIGRREAENRLKRSGGFLHKALTK